MTFGFRQGADLAIGLVESPLGQRDASKQHLAVRHRELDARDLQHADAVSEHRLGLVELTAVDEDLADAEVGLSRAKGVACLEGDATTRLMPLQGLIPAPGVEREVAQVRARGRLPWPVAIGDADLQRLGGVLALDGHAEIEVGMVDGDQGLDQCHVVVGGARALGGLDRPRARLRGVLLTEPDDGTEVVQSHARSIS